MTQLTNPTYSFKDDPDSPFIIQHSQEISDDFLSGVKEKRDASANNRMGDYHQVASIPTVVVDKWIREGFNIFDQNVKASEIVARLKSENLDAFLTTTKRV